MTPDPKKVLLTLTGVLGGQVLPEVRTPFAQQSVGLTATLLLFLAQEWDRAAARLVEESAATLELLTRAKPLVGEGGLHERIVEAERRVPGSDLHLGALQSENDQLRRLLIDVHERVESMKGEAAERLNELIWEELRQSTRRRHLEGMIG